MLLAYPKIKFIANIYKKILENAELKPSKKCVHF